MGNVAPRQRDWSIVLREGGERPEDNRAFVDYEEIDSLLNAIDVISRVDETATKLVGFRSEIQNSGRSRDQRLSTNAQRQRSNHEHRHLRSRHADTFAGRSRKSQSDDPGSQERVSTRSVKRSV